MKMPGPDAIRAALPARHLEIGWKHSFIGQIPTMISVSTILPGLAFGTMTTLIAGIYPADQASKPDPIEALRYE